MTSTHEKTILHRVLAALAWMWKNHSYVFVFIAILLAYVLTYQLIGRTFRVGHLSAILSSQNTVIIGTMAIGMALVIITGQIDLSVGSAMVLTTGVTIIIFNVTGSIPLMILGALVTGTLLGAINGFLVAYAHMPPFIVTLGGLLIYRSIALWLVRAVPPEISGSSSSQFAMDDQMPGYNFLRMKFGTGSLNLGGFQIPYVALLFFACLLLFVFITKNTRYGKAVYAVGSNAKAAELSGVHVARIKASVFMVTGLLVGVASIIQATKMGNVTPASSGQVYEMYAIAAVVLGGIAMAGGRGNMLGVLFGALSYATVSFIITAIPSLGVDIQNAFQGLILILVILVQTAGPPIRERLRSLGRRSSAPPSLGHSVEQSDSRNPESTVG
ncbi:MAG: ABC transporter permease [Propionibacteriaceae bacterium]|nr:ABC transporter permease [Propionibacteriaceae bacterium]